jgi:hypothetical protein
MGSGGGVPNHATYVTQSLGSRWYFLVYSFVRGCQRLSSVWSSTDRFIGVCEYRLE